MITLANTSPSAEIYKSIEDIPVTFGPLELAGIMGISRNKAYDLANTPGFPKLHIGKRIVISKKHFITYQLVLSQKDASGKRRQKWISTGLREKGNKRRAEAMMHKLLNEYACAHVDFSANVLFVDFMHSWLESMKNALELNSYECYHDIIARYVDTYFRDRPIPLQRLEPLHIQQLYDHYMEQGLIPQRCSRFTPTFAKRCSMRSI
jgi:hypothetical protein